MPGLGPGGVKLGVYALWHAEQLTLPDLPETIEQWVSNRFSTSATGRHPTPLPLQCISTSKFGCSPSSNGCCSDLMCLPTGASRTCR